ncbi:kinetochore protein NDC80 homolog isoform X2 [Leopardus geoffroyi]|uniref:Kinetochore protein NDC80 n=2 Tax=Felinae TaxID=338152 RepID=A0ABI7WFH7_FELCA|nr:kinetochore protein NDC80 homolog isoform X2 [Puma yagouaroundi]XP_044897596.1 kinetochore protein NDC80 homolog isoform X2 [Felis catus]XP_045315699.1 kinetochore protein NDC80 homolog isoform X2 [Leopardus geoffroyi]XP_053062123.1 kinetochore protein NDC80 homolog isoform X2 [Acinonyx jubatus]
MKRSSVSTGGAGRLSMQDLRSQDFNKQSLHTPQTKEKPGFGKLSINKPTSERKVSVFGKRTSGHGSRNSQFGIFSSSEKIKDPRPLNDKAFIQQCIRQLCEFLTENGYAYSVSMKSLQAPSVKDFLKIFTFLYGFLCPSYELPDTKFEEEVPRIFKDLGFLHTAMKESSPLFDDGQPWGEETEDGIMHNKLFLDYTIKCYESFMTGADSFEEMNTELQSKLKDLFNVDASKLESLAAKNKALNEQIARLEQEREKEPNRLESLRKLKTSLQADVQKYQAYMSNLESHSAILDQKLNGLDEEISRVELEYETMKQENTRLQNIVDNQKYSVADIERINHERNELQQTINKLTKDLEAEQQQLWNEELKYARGKEAIETQLSEYHKLARKLKLIPKGAENSKGYDFEIKFNPEAGANCLVKYRAQVYVPLKELLNQTEEEINKALNKKMSLEDTLEQLNTMITESRRGVRTLKEEVQKLDDLYQQKVKEAEEEDKKCANELESLEKHKHLLESAVNEGLSEAMNELDAIQREYQLVVQTTTEERRKVGNNLQRLLEMVATHVGSVEKHLEEQIAKVDREYEEYMSEDLLENIREIGDKYKKKAALLKASDE